MALDGAQGQLEPLGDVGIALSLPESHSEDGSPRMRQSLTLINEHQPINQGDEWFGLNLDVRVACDGPYHSKVPSTCSLTICDAMSSDAEQPAWKGSFGLLVVRTCLPCAYEHLLRDVLGFACATKGAVGDGVDQ